MNKTENFLAHHGILGMKWGVRRWQNEDGTLTERGKKKRAKQQKKIDKLNDKAIINQIKKGYSEDYTNLLSYKKLGSKRISNKDLAGVVNRLNMEDQFYQRTTPEQIKYARQYANKLRNRDIGYDMEKMHQRSKRAAGSAAYKGAKAATGWATKQAAKNAAKTAAKTALVVMSDNDISNTENFLAHHGILGMKWGVRRFQDIFGRRTAAGKKRETKNKWGTPTSKKDVKKIDGPGLLKLNKKVDKDKQMTAYDAAKLNKFFSNEEAQKMYDRARNSYTNSDNDKILVNLKNSDKYKNMDLQKSTQGLKDYTRDYNRAVAAKLNEYAWTDPRHNLILSTGEVFGQRYSVTDSDKAGDIGAYRANFGTKAESDSNPETKAYFSKLKYH